MDSNNFRSSTEGFSNEEAGRFERVADGLGGMNRGPVADIWEKVLALWNLLCEPSADLSDRLAALAALFYLVSPLDLIPDFLPGGLLDDVGVILAVVATLASRIFRFWERYARRNP